MRVVSHLVSAHLTSLKHGLHLCKFTQCVETFIILTTIRCHYSVFVARLSLLEQLNGKCILRDEATLREYFLVYVDLLVHLVMVVVMLLMVATVIRTSFWHEVLVAVET